MSLSLNRNDYNELLAYARAHSLTLTGAILRTLHICQHLDNVEHPEVRWAHLPPHERDLPGWWEAHIPKRDGTEVVTRLFAP